MWWHSVRPDIRCTFAAMRRCDATFGAGTENATDCRAGARDGHLLDYEFQRGEAYLAGRAMALIFPPALDVAPRWVSRNYETHDPRLSYRHASYFPPVLLPSCSHSPCQ